MNVTNTKKKNLVNLLRETERELSDNGKRWEDVDFISIDPVLDDESYDDSLQEQHISVEDFQRIAHETDYDSGYGGVEINLSLKIVGDDWWLERHEYDGSENWDYKERPQKPEKKLNIAKVMLENKFQDISQIVKV